MLLSDVIFDGGLNSNILVVDLGTEELNKKIHIRLLLLHLQILRERDYLRLQLQFLQILIPHLFHIAISLVSICEL